MTPGEIDFIAQRLTSMEKQIAGMGETILLLVSEVSSLKTLVHAPGECDLKQSVEEVRDWKNRVKGQLALIGFAVILLPSVIGGLIVKFWK